MEGLQSNAIHPDNYRERSSGGSSGGVKAPKNTKDSDGLSGVTVGLKMSYSWGKRGGREMWGNNSEMSESIPSGIPDIGDEIINMAYEMNNLAVKWVNYLIKKFNHKPIKPNYPKTKKENTSINPSLTKGVVPQSYKGKIVRTNSNGFINHYKYKSSSDSTEHMDQLKRTSGPNDKIVITAF